MARPNYNSEAMSLQLYYITDLRQFPADHHEQEQRLLAKIAECAAAGVEYLQLREKDLEARALEELALKVMAVILSGWSFMVRMHSPVEMFQSFIVLSSPPEAAYWPSWLQRMQRTAPVCPSNTLRQWPERLSQRRIRPSPQADSEWRLSGLMVTA